MIGPSWRKALAGIALGSLGSGCTPSLPFTTQTPPLILAPAVVSGNTDGRARFREVLCAVDGERGYYPDRRCASMLHKLNGEGQPGGKLVNLGPLQVKIRIRIVPGIFGECAESMATPFLDAVRPKDGQGYSLQPYNVDVASFRVSGRSSSANNAEEIRQQIREMRLQPDERLVLIGHSKGMSDILELIGGDRSVVPAGSSIVSLTGVVGGTPIADRGKGAYRLIRNLPLPGCSQGDGGGVESLTRAHRQDYLASHPLPADLHYYSLAAFTHRSAISTALKATHSALSKIDARNDGNVIFHDSIIPGSKVLGYLDADHWAVAMPFEVYAPKRARLFASKNHFPRVVLLEALARTIEEDLLAAADGPQH